MFVAGYRDLQSGMRSGMGGSESRSQRHKESTSPEGCWHRTEGAAQRLFLFLLPNYWQGGPALVRNVPLSENQPPTPVERLVKNHEKKASSCRW